MSQDHPHPLPSHPYAEPSSVPLHEKDSKGRRFWRKFGGDGFLISLGVHIVLLIVALTWIISRIVDSPEEPTTFVTGAGGGTQGDRVSMSEHQFKPKNARNLVRSPSKLLVKGASSGITLPEMPNMNMAALESGNLLGSSSKGIGGGAGGGEGTGIGPGRGGGRNLVSFFGMRGFNLPGLIGTFYDLKQNPNGDFRDPGVERYLQQVNRFFVQQKWSESFLRDNYFQAPEKLSATHFFIPKMAAIAAPRAYGVEDKVRPSRWLAHYKGFVKAPFSGKFRFVGVADDWLVVRWADKTVLDSGHQIVAQPGGAIPSNKTNEMKSVMGVSEVKPANLSRPLRCGPWIEVRQGQEYPMEVAIGETPGGGFYAYLFFEQEHPNRPGRGDGKVRLFRMSRDPLPKTIAKGDPAVSNLDMSGGGLVWEPRMRTRR